MASCALIASSPSRDPVASQASSGPIRHCSEPYSDPAGPAVTSPTQYLALACGSPTPRLPGLSCGDQKVPGGFAPTHRIGLRPLTHWVDFEVRITPREPSLPVALDERVKGLTQALHVLLRHRPRSISRLAWGYRNRLRPWKPPRRLGAQIAQ